MKIIRSKSFKKSYEKLSPKIQEKVDQTLFSFAEDPFDPKLNNHKLNGKYAGQRSISIMGDLRIIFEEENDYTIVIMIRIGTHSQLY